MFSDCNRVLVLAPHTDDGELGAGGTIAKLIRLGATVDYVAFTDAADSVPKGFDPQILRHEVVKANKQLGTSDVKILDFKVRYFSRDRQEILEELVKISRLVHYDLVFVPSETDKHQDHRVIHNEAKRAFPSSSIVSYVLPWNTTSEVHNLVVEIDVVDLEAKIRALSEYKSQAHRRYMQDSFQRSQAQYHGIRANYAWAETFTIERFLWAK